MTMAASTQLTTPITTRDHIRGIGSGAVTLVEYGDYACPHCNEARSVVKRLRESLGDQLCHVFRNFLTLTSYSRALHAAEAAEAAGAQNKFWEMHDLLFEHQRDPIGCCLRLRLEQFVDTLVSRIRSRRRVPLHQLLMTFAIAQQLQLRQPRLGRSHNRLQKSRVVTQYPPNRAAFEQIGVVLEPAYQTRRRLPHAQRHVEAGRSLRRVFCICFRSSRLQRLHRQPRL